MYTAGEICCWSVQDVCNWLRVEKLEAYVPFFVEKAVSGEHLLMLTPASLKEMGVSAEDSKRLLKRVHRSFKAQLFLSGPVYDKAVDKDLMKKLFNYRFRRMSRMRNGFNERCGFRGFGRGGRPGSGPMRGTEFCPFGHGPQQTPQHSAENGLDQSMKDLAVSSSDEQKVVSSSSEEEGPSFGCHFQPFEGFSPDHGLGFGRCGRMRHHHHPGCFGGPHGFGPHGAPCFARPPHCPHGGPCHPHHSFMMPPPGFGCENGPFFRGNRHHRHRHGPCGGGAGRFPFPGFGPHAYAQQPDAAAAPVMQEPTD
eukprot:GCRY01000364.1.p1 GENE.GCRY01000364.1~~GCRY01000364.1.p1  ORF type:complete len:309 (-),score=34.14 GCRY01000364.1:151-1077(-)